MYLYISYQLSQRKTIMATLHHPSISQKYGMLCWPTVLTFLTHNMLANKKMSEYQRTWLVIVSQQCQPT